MRLPPFRLERYFAAHEFSVKHLLCVSDCQTLTVGQLLDLEPGARQAFEALSLGYTEAPGGPGLRGEIARLYHGLTASDVLAHVGAQEAILNFASACLAPGDEVVVQTPCYQSLYQVAESLGCRVLPWESRPENGWRPDLNELTRLVGPNTRAVLLNSPHNPTGFAFTAAEMARVVEIVSVHGCLLFSDEVYRGLEYGPASAPRPACELYERAVSLGVMSKAYGLAGLRVGWVATRHEPVLAAMAAAKDYTSICGSAPSEFLAELALRHGEGIISGLRGLILKNLSLLDGFMRRYAGLFSWVRPLAGPICFPALASGGDAAPFCADVLSGCGVLLLPGGLYGEAWSAHFRLGFGRAGFAEGLAALDEYLANTGG